MNHLNFFTQGAKMMHYYTYFSRLTFLQRTKMYLLKFFFHVNIRAATSLASYTLTSVLLLKTWFWSIQKKTIAKI